MADTVKPFTFDETKVKEHFKKIEDSVNATQGKKGYNPFMYLQNKVNPLIEAYIKGERTEALFNKIMSLETDIKPVISNVQPEVKVEHTVRPINKPL